MDKKLLHSMTLSSSWLNSLTTLQHNTYPFQHHNTTQHHTTNTSSCHSPVQNSFLFSCQNNYSNLRQTTISPMHHNTIRTTTRHTMNTYNHDIITTAQCLSSPQTFLISPPTAAWHQGNPRAGRPCTRCRRMGVGREGRQGQTGPLH